MWNSVPHLPRGVPAFPQTVQLMDIAEGVHGVPEAFVAVSRKLPLSCETFERSPFPYSVVAGYVIYDFGLKHEESAIDPAISAERLLLKGSHHLRLIQHHL